MWALGGRERASSSPEESKREQRSKNFLSISGVHHTHTKCDDKIVDLYMSMGRVKDQYIGPVVNKWLQREVISANLSALSIDNQTTMNRINQLYYLWFWTKKRTRQDESNHFTNTYKAMNKESGYSNGTVTQFCVINSELSNLVIGTWSRKFNVDYHLLAFFRLKWVDH